MPESGAAAVTLVEETLKQIQDIAKKSIYLTVNTILIFIRFE